MPKVTIELPGPLRSLLHAPPRIVVQAETVRDALDLLIEQLPGARVHLFDETGSFREHVLCFHNETNTRWIESIDAPVRQDDTITIVQAVSGG